MKKTNSANQNIYNGMALIADPIHQYILFTVPGDKSVNETTEKTLIDSPWMQRLRRIYQLQSARWVYPAAEHSRFQHSLGTMHVAGEFAKQSLSEFKHLFVKMFRLLIM
jgi:HD superfamily phosphohydrolase